MLKNSKISKDKIKYDEPMKMHTTFKVGGLAQCFIKIDNIEDLKEVLKLAQENKIKITVIGNGSNILVLDKGISGITLNIKLEKVDIKEDNKKIQIKVGAGEKISTLAQKCLKQEITGLEELSGIPGTIGGAVRMNAGAHGKEIKDILKSVKCVNFDGNEKEFLANELQLGYRTSIFKKEKYIITEVVLELQKGNKEEIRQKMDEYMSYRKEKQPIEYASAGSTFKRGKDFLTAKLIEDAGLKGYTIGDAQISDKHSGFIINKGNATAQDIIELIEYVKNTIYEKFNKKIELEIEIIGDY